MSDDAAWFAAHGPEPELFEAALRLARCDHPEADLASYRAHLEGLAASARNSEAPSPGEALVAATAAEGYRGDTETYDDLANANLIDVIERRRGLPVALGILYIAAGRKAGWRMEGLSFPSHFLVRLEADRGRTIIDPFAGRIVADAANLRALLRRVAGAEAELAPEHTAAVSDRAVLLRLVNNLRLRLLSSGRQETALSVVERMLWLAPDDPGLTAEAAEIEVGLGRIGGAIRRLEALDAMVRDGPIKRRVATDLAQLRTRLN
jgi:regulator of sirC expression with transglutaminase-like and TPR domain